MKSRGFTLIELLVVIAILGVLAGGVLVAINPLKRIGQANDAKIKSDIGQIANASQAYFVTNLSYPKTVQQLVDNGDLKTKPKQPKTDADYDITPIPNTCDGTTANPCTDITIQVPLSAPQAEGGSYTWDSTTGQVGEIVVPTATVTPAPTATITPTPKPELAKNGSFESNMTNWGCSSGGSTCTIDSANFRPGATGTKSMKVTHISNTPPTGQSWGDDAYQSPTTSNVITAALNERFCLSGWVKRNNATDTGSIIIQDWAGTWRTSGVGIPVGTSWQLIRGTVTKAGDWTAPNIKIGLESNTVGGTIWFDDISLTRGACS